MREVVLASVGTKPLGTAQLGALAALSVVLALLGINGVLHYTMRQRTQGMGIRIAPGGRLGLSPRGGTLSSFAGLRHQPVRRAHLDRLRTPAAATVAACLLPARRATRIAPMEALHHA